MLLICLWFIFSRNDCRLKNDEGHDDVEEHGRKKSHRVGNEQVSVEIVVILIIDASDHQKDPTHTQRRDPDSKPRDLNCNQELIDARPGMLLRDNLVELDEGSCHGDWCA